MRTGARSGAARRRSSTPVGGGGFTVPPGYALGWNYDLTSSAGWVMETGIPSNADGSDRPANAIFGSGPDGTSLKIFGDRATPGAQFYTADCKATFKGMPNYHRSRAVVELPNPPRQVGMWPAIWKRPLSGEGEIDDWESFGGHGPPLNNYPIIDGTTLHTSPYDATHKKLGRAYPEFSAGIHVIETILEPNKYTAILDESTTVSITQAQFDAAAGRSAWAPNWGQASKQWYFRATLQAGGADGGPIPDSLMYWEFFVHELQFFIPA